MKTKTYSLKSRGKIRPTITKHTRIPSRVFRVSLPLSRISAFAKLPCIHSQSVQRIAKTDSGIKHRLETGYSDKEPYINYGSSIRPLSAKSANVSTRKTAKKDVKEVKVKFTEIEPGFDIFEEEKHISVIAEIPNANEEDIQMELEGNKLNIFAGMYSKIIVLHSEAESIEEKSFKNRVLQLKIKRKENADKDRRKKI